jgi:hypothetical protein
VPHPSTAPRRRLIFVPGGALKANLACSTNGTGSSNPPRSANESLSLGTLSSRRRNSARLRRHLQIWRHRRRPPFAVSGARRGQSLCWQVRRFHPRPTHDRIDSPNALGQDGAEVIEPKKNYAIPTACSCAVQRGGSSIRSAKASAVSSCGYDHFDDLRRQERQSHQSSDVTRADPFTLSDLRN